MDLLRAAAFGVSIMTTSVVTRRACPDASFESDAARVPPLQPPGWVFGVVWPILFVTTGASWVLAGRDDRVVDALFGALTALCCLWLPLYTCLRYLRASTVVLASSVAVAVAVLARADDAAPRALIAPLVAWLSFATYLNLYRLV